MGGRLSRAAGPPAPRLPDYASVAAGIRAQGFPRLRLVLALDFSSSNDWSGLRQYGGPMHRLEEGREGRNPYVHCMEVCAGVFRAAGAREGPAGGGPGVLAYRFGCLETRDSLVLPLGFPVTQEEFAGPAELLAAYRRALRAAVKSGPTSLVPLCHKLISLNQQEPEVPIVCVAITDADVPAEGAVLRATVDALALMAHRPIALVVAGLGDGEFPVLERLDRVLRPRQFDNLHFTHFTRFCAEHGAPGAAGATGAAGAAGAAKGPGRAPARPASRRAAKAAPTAAQAVRTPELDQQLAAELFVEVPGQLRQIRILGLAG